MKETAISIIIVGIIIAAAVVFKPARAQAKTEDVTVENVTIVDGKQIIDITAKGGYTPRKSIAKAGIPTILRFNTNGTFDCSAALSIPSLDVNKNLPPTGTTEIVIENPSAGVLDGTCGMGMYPFEVDFQE